VTLGEIPSALAKELIVHSYELIVAALPKSKRPAV
jgi:predicted DNA-binding protein (MmcQ/YjbR family)